MADVSQNLVYDRWLAHIFQRDVYRLNFDDVWLKEGVRAEQIYHRIGELRSAPVFIHAKISTTSLPACRFLEKLGFKLVDTNVVFDRIATSAQSFRQNCALRFAVPEDREQVVRVAGKAFTCSRFHLDEAIPSAIADSVMAEWAGNFFAGGRGDGMVVALIEDKIVGFTQLLHRNEETIVIDLIGVEGDQRQKGIASDMIAFVESQCKTSTRVLVGTQVANIPSMRLYEKMGFRVFISNYVFHYHNF